jgi:hypothetical protein
MTPTPTATPAPTAAHHATLNAFLAILERLGIIALTIAPAVSAPFLGPNASAIVAAETPVTQALAAELSTLLPVAATAS